MELVLITSDLDKEIKVKMTASDFTMRVVLLMKWRPVDYISKLLNKAKKNYEIHNKELLTIIIYPKA